MTTVNPTTEYIGFRADNGDAVVKRIHRGRTIALPLRLDLDNHSPTGFEWGYHGSGPAQLALAILADALQDDERALRLHQPFKRKVIAVLDQKAPWALSIKVVLATVKAIERERVAS